MEKTLYFVSEWVVKTVKSDRKLGSGEWKRRVCELGEGFGRVRYGQQFDKPSKGYTNRDRLNEYL